MFKIPEKKIIVNNDDRTRLLEDDGTAYADGDVTPSAGKFMIETFTPYIAGSDLKLLDTAVRIKKTAASAAVGQVSRITVTAGTYGVASKETAYMIRVVYTDLQFDTEYQNRPIEKRIQVVFTGTKDQDALAAAINAAINAHTYMPITSAMDTDTDGAGADTAAPNEVVVTSEAGIKFDIYIKADTSVEETTPAFAGTVAVETAAALPIGKYDHLKNIDWARELDFDRNEDWFPEKGASYSTYYFIANFTGNVAGTQIAGATNLSGEVAFKLYVKEGLTLATALDLLVGDVNV